MLFDGLVSSGELMNLTEFCWMTNFWNSGCRSLQKSIAALGGETAKDEWAHKWISTGFDGMDNAFFGYEICINDPISLWPPTPPTFHPSVLSAAISLASSFGCLG